MEFIFAGVMKQGSNFFKEVTNYSNTIYKLNTFFCSDMECRVSSGEKIAYNFTVKFISKLRILILWSSAL